MADKKYGLNLVWQGPHSKVYGVRSPITVKRCPLKDKPHACFNCVERALK